MRTVLFTYKAGIADKKGDQFDLLIHQEKIFSNLNLFKVPWLSEFYGVKNEFKIHLKYGGDVYVSGYNKKECSDILEYIISTLSNDILKTKINYKDYELFQVELTQDVLASIDKIISDKIETIVKEKISTKLNVKDISLSFDSEDENKNLNIRFEKNIPKKKGKNILFKVIITSTDESTCYAVIDELKEKIPMTLISD